MTGIRPVKVPVKLISEGRTREEAEGILRDEYFVSPEKAALAIETAEASIRAKDSLEKNDVSSMSAYPLPDKVQLLLLRKQQCSKVARAY